MEKPEKAKLVFSIQQKFSMVRLNYIYKICIYMLIKHYVSIELEVHLGVEVHCPHLVVVFHRLVLLGSLA